MKTISLGEWLKNLRARSGKSAAELVEGTSVSMQVIYKAEKGEQSTRLTTLHEAYKPVCRNEDEWLELVLRWTAEQNGANVNLDELRQGFDTLQAKCADALTQHAEDLAYLLKGKNPETIKLVKRFIKHSDKKGLQQMVSSYLDALEGITAQL